MGQPQLDMELGSLEGLPEPQAPEGYHLRTYREGDAAHWCRLVNAGIGGSHDEAAFRASTAGVSGFDPQGLFFAETEGELVGTACAIQQPGYPPETGYVHMVAVDPLHRGRGLGRALVLSVLWRLRQRGFQRAALQTDDFRLPAIGLYLSLGCRPRLTHESHPARWQEVYRRLGRPQ